MTPEELRERLLELEDVAYRNFHLKTCPQAEHVIGVRMPEQRKLAKEITKGDFWQFLDEIQPYYYEEVLITGIIIASAPMALAERLDYVAWFIPRINNWAVCDCFCASFKPRIEDLPRLWEFICEIGQSAREQGDAEYPQRFMLVMMLDHFLRPEQPEYLLRIFQIINDLKSDKYYVNMAIAWLVAEAFTKFRDETLDYLRSDQLSTFTHNKAIQKARESRRVSPEDKATLAALKL